MALFDEIKKLETKIDTDVPQKTRKQKLLLYLAGLEAKIKQAEYAISRIEQYEDRYDAVSSTTEKELLNIKEQVEFFCDTFWIFLYSILDVLAQIINHAYQFNINEKDVSFKGLKTKIESSISGSEVETEYKKIRRSNVFKNAEKYRNCSAHRRPIYIQEQTTSITGTKGYTVTSTQPLQGVERIICDDPLSISPRCAQKRIVPDYLRSSMDNLSNNICNLIKKMELL